MDHRFDDLKRLRGMEEITGRGESRAPNAHLAGKADVGGGATLIDGGRPDTVTRVTEAIGYSDVDLLEAAVK